MTARAARDGFTDLLGAVYYGKKSIAVEKKGRVFAIVVNPDEYETLKKAAKMRFFGIVDDIQRRNKNKNIEAVMKDVTTVVERVRQESRGENG
jgi:hypothetical protein